MISERSLVRLRTALDEWFIVVVVALLALSLVGGWAAYGAVATPTDDDTDQQATEAWTTTGDFEHGATVQEENDVFDVGDDLTDRPVYFTDITPELESTFHFVYEASTGDVDIDVEAERVIRAVDDETDAEHWATNETIAENSDESLEPTAEHSTEFTVDVPSVMNESDAAEESLGGSVGTVETAVAVHVTMTGTIDGEPVDQVERYELVIDSDDSTYAVETPEADRQSPEQSETEGVATADSTGFLGPLSGALITFLSVCALGALVLARANGALAPSPADLERVRAQYEREEFDDWISRGSLPEDIRERSRIEVSTLEDLVDVAIDCDRRVLEDEHAGEFYVVDGESLYVYEPVELEDGDGDLDDDDIVLT